MDGRDMRFEGYRIETEEHAGGSGAEGGLRAT